MPDMNAKATDINDTFTLVERIEYRDRRMHEKLSGHMDDPQAFVKMMAGYNAADLRQLRLLLAGTEGAQS